MTAKSVRGVKCFGEFEGISAVIGLLTLPLVGCRVQSDE